LQYFHQFVGCVYGKNKSSAAHITPQDRPGPQESLFSRPERKTGNHMRLLLLQKLPRLKYIIKKSYISYFNISKRAELMRRESRNASYPCCLVDRCTQTDEGHVGRWLQGELVASPGRLSPTEQI